MNDEHMDKRDNSHIVYTNSNKLFNIFNANQIERSSVDSNKNFSQRTYDNFHGKINIPNTAIEDKKGEQVIINPFHENLPIRRSNSDETITDKSNEVNLREQDNQQFNIGRWSEEEHRKFMKGILIYGNDWKKVQNVLQTRSSTQARSHAQKFFLRVRKYFHSLRTQGISNDLFQGLKAGTYRIIYF